MDRVRRWIAFLVRPGSGFGLVLATLLATGIVAALYYWLEAWSWLSHQTDTVRFAIYLASWVGSFVLAIIIVSNVMAPIHYAIDPTYTTEREQKRRVRQMKIGERVTVTDDMGVEYGTVTKVSPGGESFEITWDNDGHTNVSYYFDVDLFEFVNSGQHSRERANATPGNRHA